MTTRPSASTKLPLHFIYRDYIGVISISFWSTGVQEDDSDDQIVPVHLRNPEEASCYASHTSSCFFRTYLLGAHRPLATLLDWPSARMRRKLLLEQSIRPWAQRPEELPEIFLGPTKTVYSGPRGRRLQKAAVCECLHVTYATHCGYD